MIDVGLIGFGLAGRYFHAPLIHAVPGCGLLPCCNAAQRSRQALSRRAHRAQHRGTFGHRFHPASGDCLAQPDAFPFAMQCLEAGRDVVVDKPITPALPEAIELFRIAKKCGRLLTCSTAGVSTPIFKPCIRSSPAVNGAILRFETHYDRYRPTSRANAWREVPGPGSGILFDLGPHLMDHAMMLSARRKRLPPTFASNAQDFSPTMPSTSASFIPATCALICARHVVRHAAAALCASRRKGNLHQDEFDALESALRREDIPKVRRGSSIRRKIGRADGGRGWPNAEAKSRFARDWREFYANVRDVLLGRRLQVTPKQVIDVMMALELAQESQALRCVIPCGMLHSSFVKLGQRRAVRRIIKLRAEGAQIHS